MNKVLIVIMFILLGTSLIVVSNMGKDVQNSFIVEYHNNKNLALPDLTGKTEITAGLYRLEHIGTFTLDYNIYNGIYTFNGELTTRYDYAINLDVAIYTYTFESVGGSFTAPDIIQGLYLSGVPSNRQDISYDNLITKKIGTAQANRYYLILSLGGPQSFNNYQIKIQIEKCSTATSYVVPKLIPVYKDNLTQQEKNEIGIGAFGGISKILKTINDIIKPVGDFINGLLNMF